jgi:hypothetical protein
MSRRFGTFEPERVVPSAPVAFRGGDVKSAASWQPRGNKTIASTPALWLHQRAAISAFELSLGEPYVDKTGALAKKGLRVQDWK